MLGVRLIFSSRVKYEMKPLSCGEILLDDLSEGCSSFEFEIDPEKLDFEHEFYALASNNQNNFYFEYDQYNCPLLF
mgnify:CR=1 FL=1